MAAGENSAAGAGCIRQPAAGGAFGRTGAVSNDFVIKAGAAAVFPLPEEGRDHARLHGARIISGPLMRAFDGVAVRLAPPDDDGGMFELVLIHADRRRDLVVGRWDDADIAAVWRDFSAASGLPLLLEREDGSLVCPRPQMGRVQLGAIRIRRRHGLLNGRRPRFLVRRKTGKPLTRPVRVHGRDMMGRD